MKELIKEYIKLADTYFMMYEATGLYHHRQQALACLKLARQCVKGL